MECVVCGRPVGQLHAVWSDDPVICSEECAERQARAANNI